MNKSFSNFLLGFLAGAAAGAIAGILFAPGKGSETRQNIRNGIRDLSDEFGLGINELIDEMGLETEPDIKPSVKRKRKIDNTEEQPKRKYTRKQNNA